MRGLVVGKIRSYPLGNCTFGPVGSVIGAWEKFGPDCPRVAVSGKFSPGHGGKPSRGDEVARRVALWIPGEDAASTLPNARVSSIKNIGLLMNLASCYIRQKVTYPALLIN